MIIFFTSYVINLVTRARYKAVTSDRVRVSPSAFTTLIHGMHAGKARPKDRFERFHFHDL